VTSPGFELRHSLQKYEYEGLSITREAQESERFSALDGMAQNSESLQGVMPRPTITPVFFLVKRLHDSIPVDKE